MRVYVPYGNGWFGYSIRRLLENPKFASHVVKNVLGLGPGSGGGCEGVKIFALGDPHLSFGRPKPMDIFGPLWADHPRQIAEAWDAVVGADDVVLVPGDISWAHNLAEAAPDLAFLAERPGRLKVLLRGNHDSWWSSIGKVRAVLAAGPRRPRQGCAAASRGGRAVRRRAAGTCPTCPGAIRKGPADLPPRAGAAGAFARGGAPARAARRRRSLALLHYPPLGPGGSTSRVLEKLAAAGLRGRSTGHLHADDHLWAPRGNHAGVDLRLRRRRLHRLRTGRGLERRGRVSPLRVRKPPR